MTNIYIPIPTATSRWKLVGDAAGMQFLDIFLGIVTSIEELYFRGGCAVLRSTEEHQCLTDRFVVTVFLLFLYLHLLAPIHLSGWWFQTFSIIYGIIIPID